MDSTKGESHVLERFAEKCRIAGGPKAGYNLRRDSIVYGWDEALCRAADEALASLVDQGILAANEAEDRFSLTEDGVEALGG